MVELIKFEPVTLARLDCIPTRAHGNEKTFPRFHTPKVLKNLRRAHFFKSARLFILLQRHDLLKYNFIYVIQ